MDRTNRDRDNISQGGKSIHTYTPRSHEDLLKSHLNLDASRKAKLQNDLQKVTNENVRLRNELAAAYQNIQNKEDKINDLLNKLSNQPRVTPSVTIKEPPRVSEEVQIFEVDGQPVSIEYLINHFNVVIRRHHDLLNIKNKQIHDLLYAQNKQHFESGPERRHITTQSTSHSQDRLNDFNNELAQVRKEYEEVERVLKNRNNNLENHIEDLKRNLCEYSKEIDILKKELEKRDAEQPGENTLRLVQDLEKENKRLKEIIKLSKNQNHSLAQMVPESTVINSDLDNLIKTIIQERQDAINKLNSMLNELKSDHPGGTDPQSISGEKITEPNLEKECQDVMSDVNKINEKLNALLNKLKDPASPKGVTDKTHLISNLENLKKQCQVELEKLKTKSPTDDGNRVVLRGQAVVSIDHSNYLKNKLGTPGIEDESLLPIETPSNVEFNLYLPQPSSPARPLNQFYPIIPQSYSTDSNKKHLPYTDIPCEACSSTNVLFKSNKTPPQRSVTPPTKSKERLVQPNAKIHEFYAPSSRALSKERKTGKSKDKGGCCGKKGSDSSNYPYSKKMEEERIVNVHGPYIDKEISSTDYNNRIVNGPHKLGNPSKGRRDTLHKNK